jgi:hypothetical protein
MKSTVAHTVENLCIPAEIPDVWLVCVLERALLEMPLEAGASRHQGSLQLRGR